jgi:hypothetical protein
LATDNKRIQTHSTPSRHADPSHFLISHHFASFRIILHHFAFISPPAQLSLFVPFRAGGESRVMRRSEEGPWESLGSVTFLLWRLMRALVAGVGVGVWEERGLGQLHTPHPHSGRLQRRYRIWREDELGEVRRLLLFGERE